jgi:hypothetical protein
MRVVGRLIVARLRAGWRGWLALALLAGVAGGAVLTAAAGALRTDAAYPAFLRQSAASSVLTGPGGTGLGSGFYPAMGRLPGVTAIAPVVGIQALPVGPGGRTPGDAVVAAPLDGRYLRQMDRPRLLAGRLPRPGAAAEVAVSQITAGLLHLHVGSRVPMVAVPGTDVRHERRFTERVVGIMVIRGSVLPVTDLDREPVIIGSTALWRELGQRYEAFDGAYVRLAPGTTVAGFSREVSALAAQRRYAATGGQMFVSDESVQAATIEREIRPQSLALAAFALVLALTGFLIVGQVTARQALAGGADDETLRALGMTRRQLAGASLGTVAVAGLAAAGLAVGIAVAASPMMPIGPARLADPSPGPQADLAVLLPGAAAIVVLLVARAAVTAWRETAAGRPGPAPAPARGPAPAAWLAAAGAPATAVTGVRLALDPGRGRRAVPVRSALLGTALSVTAVVAALTFGASLLRLVQTPRLYGQSWDAAIDVQFGNVEPGQVRAITARVPAITAWTYGMHGTVSIGRTVVPAIGLVPGRGALISPTVLTGRAPAARDEIVLGTTVLRQAGLRVGQHVRVAAAGRPVTMRITGSAVFPFFGQGSFTPTDLGQGAIAPAAVLAAESGSAGASAYNFVLFRFAAGTSRTADLAALRRAAAPYCASVEQSTCVVAAQRPNGVTNYQLIDKTPDVLAALLAALGLAAGAQFAVACARRRRRDFAVLRTLGMVRGQLIAVTAWQMSTLAGAALVIGLPAGLAAGHWAWALFAAAVGVAPGLAVPAAALALTIPAVLLAANAAGYLAGRTAAAAGPAALFRTE